MAALGQTTGAPVIATLSNSATIPEGQNFSLSVSVNGQPPFTYQWRKDGAHVASATLGTLAFAPLRVGDAGTYTVVVTNAVGSTTSGPVLLAVTPASPPRFYSNPSDVSGTIGSTLPMSASVDGTTPMTFEWRRNGAAVATTTSSSYTIPNAQTSHAGTYLVVATNLVGSATSAAFTVTVTPPAAPVIVSHPTDRVVGLNESLDLGVDVRGTSPLSYQMPLIAATAFHRVPSHLMPGPTR